MGPPRSYNNTEVALFITATQPVDPGLLAELNTTADKWAQSDGTLHVFADDGAGHDFKGWSHQQLALWTVHHLGGDGTSSLTSQCATGAIAVLDDQGVAQRYVEIVGLDMDWPDKFSPAQISQAIAHNGFLDGLVKDTLKVCVLPLAT